MLLHKGARPSLNGGDYNNVSVSPNQDQGKDQTAKPARRSSTLKFILSSTSSPVKARAIEPPADTSSKKPTNAQEKWTADFLNDLRTNRPARPSGARPPPASRNTAPVFHIPDEIARPASGLTKHVEPQRHHTLDVSDLSVRTKNTLSHRGEDRAVLAQARVGRPLVQPPVEALVDRALSKPPAPPSPTKVDIPYYERGQRWMEKQEAHSLRVALDHMDLKDEQRLHEAAEDEAAKLVWEHHNSDQSVQPSTKEEDRYKPYKYKEHLRKGSHARSQSIGPLGVLDVIVGTPVPSQRSASDSSTSSRNHRTVSTSSKDSDKSAPGESGDQSEQQLPRKTSFGSLSFPIRTPKVFGRKISNPKSRKSTTPGDSLFSNPEDKIYEEPEDEGDVRSNLQSTVDTTTPLKPKARNTSGTYYQSADKAEKIGGPRNEVRKLVSAIDIHKNPPSQSRKAFYRRNEATDKPNVAQETNGVSTAEETGESPGMNNGLEVRSDEIRAATSMKLKDRSAKLPTPTVVSDRPGRPIVSFDRGYKPREDNAGHVNPPSFPNRDLPTIGSGLAPKKPSMPTSTVSSPAVPTISIGEVPQISISEASTVNTRQAPSIFVNDTPTIRVNDVPSTLR